MKKACLIFGLVLVLFSGVTGCKKVLKKIFPGLDVNLPEIVVDIPYFPLPPGTPVPLGEVAFPSYTQEFNLDSVIRLTTGDAFNSGDVSSVKVKQIDFKVANPDQQNNFSNFQSARFTFKSNTNSTAVPIAAFTFADTYIASTSYTATDDTPELRPYLNGTKLIYRVYGKLRRYPTKGLQLSVAVKVRVK